MCHECLKKIKMEVGDKLIMHFDKLPLMEMHGEHIPEYVSYYSWQSASSSRDSRSEPTFSPGQGVTVVDGKDTNKGRDGFVRDSTPGPHHQSLDTNEYHVWFEPGERDYKYKIDQLEPNHQFMDPTSMPEVKQ